MCVVPIHENANGENLFLLWQYVRYISWPTCTKVGKISSFKHKTEAEQMIRQKALFVCQMGHLMFVDFDSSMSTKNEKNCWQLHHNIHRLIELSHRMSA